MSTIAQLDAVAALLDSDSDLDTTEHIDVTVLFLEEVQSEALEGVVSDLFKNTQQVLPGTSAEARRNMENAHAKAANKSIKGLARARKIGMPDGSNSDEEGAAKLTHKFAPIFGEQGLESDGNFATLLKKMKKCRGTLILDAPIRAEWKTNLVSSIRADTRGPEGRQRYGIATRPSEEAIMIAVEAFWKSWSGANAKGAKKSRDKSKKATEDLKKELDTAISKMRAAQDELDSAKVAHEGQLAALKADGEAAVAKVRSDAAEKFVKWTEKEWDLRERCRTAESRADAAETKCKTYEEMMNAWRNHANAVDRGSPKRKRSESPSDSDRFGGSSLPSYDSL